MLSTNHLQVILDRFSKLNFFKDVENYTVSVENALVAPIWEFHKNITLSRLWYRGVPDDQIKNDFKYTLIKQFALPKTEDFKRLCGITRTMNRNPLAFRRIKFGHHFLLEKHRILKQEIEWGNKTYK